MKKPYRTLRCTIQSDTCESYTHCGDFTLRATLSAKGKSGIKDLARIEMEALADGSVKLVIYDQTDLVIDSIEFEI